MNLITVIVPIYKVEDYLRYCVDSIVNQTYSNLEIILCDDGSPDSCPQICDEYALKDSRVRVIHKENGGLSDARNEGLNIATGEYITFVDSDDCLELDMIEHLYKLMDENKADLSCCQRQEIDEEGNKIENDKKHEKLISVGRENCMRDFLCNPNMDTVAWGKLYKAEMFKDIRYPKGKYNEDVFTTYKIIAKCKKVISSPEQKYLYRIRSTSIMNESFSTKHLDGIEGAKIRASFIKSNYPGLAYVANANIVYATNQCVLRLMHTSSEYEIPKDIISDLQKNYRSYEGDFLRGPSGVRAKLFSLPCYVNLPMVIKVLRNKK